MLTGKQKSIISNSAQWVVIISYSLAIILPLTYAIMRLEAVTGVSSIESIFTFFEQPLTKEALRFTILESLFSVALTLTIGLPLAWQLSRYEWKRIAIIRSLLSIPFVMPSIVAAMGFLALIDQGGPLQKIGIDLRGESGVFTNISSFTGLENPGHFIALIIAHAWFNISLIVRMVEPTLSTMDPRWEEQIKLLPAGNTRLGRVKNLWMPFIGPAIACASALCFVFSFTSFALVKWLTPNNSTLESLMADSGGTAGIYNYRIDTSEIVLSICIVQLIILVSALALTSRLQRKHSLRHAMVSESSARRSRGRPTISAKIIVSVGLVFTLLPLALVTISSFIVRTIEDGSITNDFSLDAWKAVYDGDNSTVGLQEALSNSLIYSLITLIFSITIGWVMASSIHRLEKSGNNKLAKIVDMISLAPLAISAVMIGLGILLGILRWSPSLFNWFLIPVLPHILLTTPFVVRIMLPAIRSLDSSFEEQAGMLGLSPLKIWIHSKLSFLLAPLAVAGSLTIAFSLGEFGATWILVRSGSWDTLSILVDQLMSQPKFNPLIYPMAMASATVLMILTFILFLLAEKVRPNGEGSGF
ncbi:MAG: iron ABC transporter permease [Candidatus Poseidoniales archaeon]|nr:MAG: iron ABC transporter permease [Candidatus Poseidoniales archaeon]|tara:strand:+ start:9048 stop:10808 length:1761 start_codon:yes stop_codon:yes gene_type:complete